MRGRDGKCRSVFVGLRKEKVGRSVHIQVVLKSVGVFVAYTELSQAKNDLVSMGP
jgi:hypothetical protein